MGDAASAAAMADLPGAGRPETSNHQDDLGCLVQTDDDIRLLIDWLRSQLPHSDKVFHTLRCALTPFRPHLHLSVYADSQSHDTLTTVLIMYGPANAHNAQQQQQQQHHSTTQRTAHQTHHPTPTNQSTYAQDAYNISFHTTNPPTAVALLQRYVDLTRPVDFAGIERRYRPVVEEVRRWYEAAHGDEEVEFEYDECNHWDYPFLVPPPAPVLTGASPTAAASTSAVRFARLAATMETGSLIASHWPYSSASTASLIHSLLLAAESDTMSPSAASYGAYRDDQLVAWEVKQSYGAIGMLHVKDSERRSGVGRQLVRRVVEVALEDRQQQQAAAAAAASDGSDIVDSQLQMDEATDGRVRVYDEYTPFCYTTASNAASRGLFESLGFESRFDVDWIVWTPTVRYKTTNDT